MPELDGYERNMEYYHERTDELRFLIRHLDVHCASFCVESDGIRVAMVSELLKNALCYIIKETQNLLDEYVKPGMIAQIVEEAIDCAKAETKVARSTGDPLEKLDMEAERAKLKQEMEDKLHKGLHEELGNLMTRPRFVPLRREIGERP